MVSLPNYRFIRFRFYAPIGVEDVHLEDASIAGRWKKNTTRYYGVKEKTLAERFANCRRESADIQRFTEGYGPLAGNPYTEREFKFSLESWRGSQDEFCKFWNVLVRARAPGGYQPLEGNAIEIRDRWLHFRCGALWTFMTLELLSRPEKTRVCLRPNCKQRYFIAQHGKERYCSPECGNWSQAQLKKRWHKEQRQKRELAKRQRATKSR